MAWYYWLLLAYVAGGVLTSVFVAFMPWFLSLFERLMIFLLWPAIWVGLIGK